MDQMEKTHAAHDMHEMKKETSMVKKLQFALNAKSGSSASGMVMFTEENGEVTLEAHINGLTPEFMQSMCTKKQTVLRKMENLVEDTGIQLLRLTVLGNAKQVFHRGDIGNFNADETGHGMITFSTNLWCLDCDDDTKNLIGKAIIVHQGEDDLSSQPSGAAGARVSCAGIIQ